MKSLFVLVFTFLLSPPTFASGCPVDEVDGYWQNPQWIHFRAKCANGIATIAEYPAGPRYEIDLTGRNATEIDLWGMKFELTLKPASQRFLEGTMIWRIGQRPGSPSAPGFGLVVQVSMPGVHGTPATVMSPTIVSFKYERGNLGNLFDEGMELAVGVLNRFGVADVLAGEFMRKNFLVRIDPSRMD